MSYKFSFADNATYSAVDVNAITKRLVTSGIEDNFTDGVAYNVSKFNEAGKLLYTSGAVPESCLSLKVEDAGNGKILVNPGKAFFDDGAVIEIEAGGETLSYVSGFKNYVYLKNDLADKNKCYPYCGTQEPAGDYVMLAEIDASGNITDKRTYAKGKLPGYQSVAGNVLVINETATKTAETSGSDLSGSVTFDIGSNNYEYILVLNTDGGSCLGVYDITNNIYLGYGYYRSRAVYSNAYVTSYSDDNHYKYTELTFDISNGKLTVNYYRYDNQSGFTAGRTYTAAIKLFLF